MLDKMLHAVFKKKKGVSSGDGLGLIALLVFWVVVHPCTKMQAQLGLQGVRVHTHGRGVSFLKGTSRTPSSEQIWERQQR